MDSWPTARSINGNLYGLLIGLGRRALKRDPRRKVEFEEDRQKMGMVNKNRFEFTKQVNPRLLNNITTKKKFQLSWKVLETVVLF